MKTQPKILYLAPATQVLELTLDAGILTLSSKSPNRGVSLNVNYEEEDWNEE